MIAMADINHPRIFNILTNEHHYNLQIIKDGGGYKKSADLWKRPAL
jgi:hypothetical protein